MIVSVGIIGSGKMGMDIFNFFNEYPLKLVLICETDAEANERLRAFGKFINRKVKNGLLDQPLADNKINNTIISSNISDIKECNLVIECIPENLKQKQQLFKTIEHEVSSDTLLVSNTSSIKITDLADSLENNERFFGLHFFYPVKLRNVTEVNTHHKTSSKSIDKLAEFLRSINRFFLIFSEESNFLLNKIFLDFQALGFWFYKNASISITTLDNLIKRNLFPIGIFDFFDSVGIDTMLVSIRNYTKYSNEDIYGMLINGLESLVQENKLGIKTGCGFYDYGSEPKEGSGGTEDISDQKHIEIVNGLRASYINSAFRFIEQGFISGQDIDYAVQEYMGVEKGPVALADEIGYTAIVNSLEEIHKITGSSLFCPSSLLENK